MTNLTLQTSTQSAKSIKSKKTKGPNESLAINKSVSEQERTKKQLKDKHQKHLSKVTIGKQTLQHEGSVYRTIGASTG